MGFQDIALSALPNYLSVHFTASVYVHWVVTNYFRQFSAGFAFRSSQAPRYRPKPTSFSHGIGQAFLFLSVSATGSWYLSRIALSLGRFVIGREDLTWHWSRLVRLVSECRRICLSFAIKQCRHMAVERNKLHNDYWYVSECVGS